MKPGTKIIDQVRRNFVAIVSLAVAVTSLGYNTWRNEASESNRNQRLVSIEVLRNLGELQQVVYHRHWDMDAEDKGNPLTGWAIVLTISDLAQVLEAPLPDSAERLRVTWDEQYKRLGSGKDDEHIESIVEAINQVRVDTHALLQGLD
ncbi:MAG: hypothetical protein OER91_13485 [Gammaproteobacteria bacterium]|nr:hypothetical protein [Gammaproteobacteria bacterium]